MRVFVKVCCAGSVAGQTYTIPCNDPAASVGYLKAQALDRWGENNGKKSKGGEERKAEEFQLKFSGNGALLSDKDVIRDVLRDGEFVNLCPLGVPHAASEADCNARLPTYTVYPLPCIPTLYRVYLSQGCIPLPGKPIEWAGSL
jgi:hypothetical protein